jgi:hypothetical protein
MPRALVAASLLFDYQHCLRLCLNHRVMVSKMRSYPSLIVEVIVEVFVCRGNRFSMLIEASLKFTGEANAMRFAPGLRPSTQGN